MLVLLVHPPAYILLVDEIAKGVEANEDTCPAVLTC
jgi:hypothetical protein